MHQTPNNPPAEHAAEPTAETRPSFLRIMAAPWIAIVRPRVGGRLIRHAGPLAVVLLFAQMVLVSAALVVLLVTWERMTELDSQVMNPWTTQPSATLPEDRSMEMALKQRSFGEGVRIWSANGWTPLFGMAVGITVLALLF